MRMDLDLDQLEALATAVAEGTLDAAAHRLHVTPSAISQRIKALESAVGRVLLTRTKPVAPTRSGETLLRAARQIQAITADAARELGDEDGGRPSSIALAVNADSLATWLVPALASVAPPAAFDLRRDDETRTAALLRDGTVMAAVTASGTPVPGCIVAPLGRMRYRARASAAFAAEWFADGVTVGALATAPVVCFDRGDLIQAATCAGGRGGRWTRPATTFPDRGRSSRRCAWGWAGAWFQTSRPARSPASPRWWSSTSGGPSTSRCSGSSGGCARRRWSVSPRRFGARPPPVLR